MPYPVDDTKSIEMVKQRLRKTYSNVTDKLARTFAHAFNAVYQSTHGDEGRAMASGYAAVNRAGAEKLQKKPVAKRVVQRKANILAAAVLRVAMSTLPATVQEARSIVFVHTGTCPKSPESVGLDYGKGRTYCRKCGRDCRMLQMIMPDGKSIYCKASNPKNRKDKDLIQ